jgi:hypothetical protein
VHTWLTMHSTGMRKLLDRLSAERLQKAPDVTLRRCTSSSASCSPSRPSAWCPSGVQGCSRPWLWVLSNGRTSPWERPSVVALPRTSASPSSPCRPSPERPPPLATTPVTVFVAARCASLESRRRHWREGASDSASRVSKTGKSRR